MRIFVTVGNRTEPFDRLLAETDRALSRAGRRDDRVDGLCQAGSCSYRMQHLPSVDYLDRAAFRRQLARADAVVCHAGVGTIHAAIAAGHRPLVMARRASRGECLNDHQLEIVAALQEKRTISAVTDAVSIASALDDLSGRDTGRRIAAAAASADLERIRRTLAAHPARPAPGPLRRGLLRLLATGAPPLERLLVAHGAQDDQTASSEKASRRET